MALNLPLLPNGQAIVTPNGIPTMAFTLYWQQVLEAVETAFNALEDAVNAIAAAQAAADTANAAAATANAAAATAQAAADTAVAAIATVSTASALSSSYVSGVTIAASDNGTDATVTISAHTRHYPQADGTTVDVAVAAGEVSGLVHGLVHYIFYDDPARTGGTVLYQVTLSEATAAQTGARHTVGRVTAPLAGAPSTVGAYTRPPGPGQIGSE